VGLFSCFGLFSFLPFTFFDATAFDDDDDDDGDDGVGFGVLPDDAVDDSHVLVGAEGAVTVEVATAAEGNGKSLWPQHE
jgi:hypothetical protein